MTSQGRMINLITMNSSTKVLYVGLKPLIKMRQ